MKDDFVPAGLTYMKKEFPIYDICRFSLTLEEDVTISNLAVYLKNLKSLHFPHRHDFYHLMLFTRGAGSHSIDFQQFSVKPYHFYFMAPGQVHNWHFEGDIDGYVINFSAVFFKSFLLDDEYLEQFAFLSGNVNYSVIDLTEELQPDVIRTIDRAVLEANTVHPFRLDSIRIMLLDLFILLAKVSKENEGLKLPENQPRATLKKFEKLIEKEYQTMRLPKQYAEKLFISPGYLNTICQDVLGISAGDMIRNRIILEAKRMLVNLSLTVSEIAWNLNFADNSHFCKFFKNHVGMSPKSFRKHTA
ncbi:AraC-type DNA-binding protein [Pedobacter westerhofensis]|uniref:AraC-type DNA-binding protein n=2 Tax=Pedobacter westerhofensis TaxID=425512 RepID=A0A521BE22_9SPHI|nr:AraC-type DNA-binding protein [Pedobacter westerhofensis]